MISTPLIIKLDVNENNNLVRSKFVFGDRLIYNI